MSDNNQNSEKAAEQGGQVDAIVRRDIPDIVCKEIDTIKEIADSYMRLKSLLPNYQNEYLEAYEYLANRFDSIGA